MEKGPANPEVKEKVVAYLETVLKAKSKEIAAAIGEKKADVDLAVKDLAMEDVVEYLYITTNFIALKGKVGAPE
jgi:Mn-dependent DtxR family transcriptional regulator